METFIPLLVRLGVAPIRVMERHDRFCRQTAYKPGGDSRRRPVRPSAGGSIATRRDGTARLLVATTSSPVADVCVAATFLPGVARARLTTNAGSCRPASVIVVAPIRRTTTCWLTCGFAVPVLGVEGFQVVPGGRHGRQRAASVAHMVAA